MTGGWAATNTLREAARYYDAATFDPKAKDALALVEAALNAAEQLLESRLWTSGDGSESWQKANALAAALRAVREGTQA